MSRAVSIRPPKQPGETDPMRAALRNMRAGRSPFHGLHGRSAHGGAENTTRAMIRRGWLIGVDAEPYWSLTEAGSAEAAALDAWDRTHGKLRPAG